MKKVEIEAYNGIGKAKKLAGKRVVDMPETPEEAVQLFGKGDEKLGLEETMDYIRSSYTIEVQRQIRAGTTMSAKQQLAAVQAYARANPESEVAKTLKALEISLGGEQSEAPEKETTPSDGETQAS